MHKQFKNISEEGKLNIKRCVDLWFKDVKGQIGNYDHRIFNLCQCLYDWIDVEIRFNHDTNKARIEGLTIGMGLGIILLTIIEIMIK